MDWTCAPHLRYENSCPGHDKSQKVHGHAQHENISSNLWRRQKTEHKLSGQNWHTDCVALKSNHNGSPNSFYNHAVIVTVLTFMTWMNIYKPALRLFNHLNRKTFITMTSIANKILDKTWIIQSLQTDFVVNRNMLFIVFQDQDNPYTPKVRLT
jgi:hypothetical protein